MSVIQRCPSCGTTQPTGGVCATCHEADVRYFCTSHDPGIWLDDPTCPRSAEHRASTPPRPAVERARVATESGGVTSPRARERSEPAAIPVAARARPAVTFAPRPSLPGPAAERPALWESVVRGAMVARRGSESVTRASSWLSKLVMRLVMIALLLGIGFVALIYFAAQSLG